MRLDRSISETAVVVRRFDSPERVLVFDSRILDRFGRFQGIRRRYFGLSVVPPASRRLIADADKFWDCHNCYDSETTEIKEQSLVGGIMQLAKAIGLKQHLPDGFPVQITLGLHS